jgi:hypothetical protein
MAEEDEIFFDQYISIAVNHRLKMGGKSLPPSDHHETGAEFRIFLEEFYQKP